MSELAGYRSVTPIPRVGDISPEHFERDYYSKERPVIICGKMAGWRAMREWSPEGLKAIFGDAVLSASLDLPTELAPGHYKWAKHNKWMRLAEFVDFMAESERPCYMRQAPSNRMPDFDKYFDFGVFFVDVGQRDPQPNLWFGSRGTDSGLHWDTAMNFLAQVQGRKELIIFPPSETPNLYSFSEQIRWSGFNALTPDFATYPKARRAHAMTAILAPGEAIYIPRTWWHQLRSMETAISINCFFRPECSLWKFAAAIANGGPASVFKVSADFVRLGMLKGRYETRMFADIPTGLYLYNLCTGFLKRRFG